jgi:FtsP/CotA-like multicopper oxidase with cupredoxin domain
MAVLVIAVLLSLAVESAIAGWFSPVYKNFYSVPLPIAPIKAPKATFKNPNTGGTVNYYEIEIKPVEIQIYPPPMKKARFVGYDGMIPGPTFMQQKGEEAIVRFINHGDRSSSIHLHGSYSRAPFDGYADDITPIDGYKDYCMQIIASKILLSCLLTELYRLPEWAKWPNALVPRKSWDWCI